MRDLVLMAGAYVACACVLVLLCPLTLADDFVSDNGVDEVQIIFSTDNSVHKLPKSDEFHLVRNRTLAYILHIPKLNKHRDNGTRKKRQTEIEAGDNDYTYEDEGEDDQGSDYEPGSDEEGQERQTTSAPMGRIPSSYKKSTQFIIVPDVPTSSRTLEKNISESSDQLSTAAANQTPEAWPDNHPPALKPNIKTLAITVTAGKAFSNIIPADLFWDPEDGKNLTLSMYEADNTKLGRDSWIQFLPYEREVYGLPLEWDVGRWKFTIEAKDSEGLTAHCPLDITVNDHKDTRTINHKFFLEFKLNQPFANSIDWQIRALEGIVNLFGDSDMEKLTVLDASQTGENCEFVWTNDTIQKDGIECPIEDILDLWRVISDDSGSPSAGTIAALQPELSARGTRWEGRAACAMPPAHATPNEHPYVFTVTAGHLFVQRLENSKNSNNIDLTLRHSDGTGLSPTYWLQWDPTRREIFGVPLPVNVGISKYKLVSHHHNKNKAHDDLVVIKVTKPASFKPSAEFHITLNYSYVDLAYNTTNKRNLIEHIASIFGQTETKNIRIVSISKNPTTVIWYNTSLSTEKCPVSEIKTLYNIIHNDNQDFIDNPYNITTTKIIPLGVCADVNPEDLGILYHEASASLGQPNEPEYSYLDSYSGTDTLITFIVPTVILLSLFLILAIFASVIKKSAHSARGYPRVRVTNR